MPIEKFDTEKGTVILETAPQRSQDMSDLYEGVAVDASGKVTYLASIHLDDELRKMRGNIVGRTPNGVEYILEPARSSNYLLTPKVLPLGKFLQRWENVAAAKPPHRKSLPGASLAEHLADMVRGAQAIDKYTRDPAKVQEFALDTSGKQYDLFTSFPPTLKEALIVHERELSAIPKPPAAKRVLKHSGGHEPSTKDTRKRSRGGEE